MNRDFYPLTVAAVREEISEAKTVMFTVPDALQDTFRWRAGQHLTLRFKLNGEELRRSYSISSSPFSGDPLRITVKRVKNGQVSNHINDQVQAGDILEVMPPFGGFHLDPQPNGRRTHYFFGAGSGVTPLFAMLHSVLLAEPHSDVSFVYGNTSDKTIIFNNALQQLATEHGQRCTVEHVLSNPSLWSGQDYWRTGRLDKEAIASFIHAHPPYSQDTHYYLCGPGSMNQTVQAALAGLDVPTGRIHSENYGGAVATNDAIKGMAATAQITLHGQSHKIAVAAGQTVLAAVRQAGLEPPFSCQAGVCGACRAQLTAGTVHMRTRVALEDADVAGGAVLTCQALATAPLLTLEYG